MTIRLSLVVVCICGSVVNNAVADVTIVLNAYNLPEENDKALQINEENLGVVVLQELNDNANKVVHSGVFKGPQVKFHIEGIEPNDVLSFSFARNSPQDPRVTDTTKVITGMVVTGELMTLDVVIPVPQKKSENQRVVECPAYIPCRPVCERRPVFRIFGRRKCW